MQPKDLLAFVALAVGCTIIVVCWDESGFLNTRTSTSTPTQIQPYYTDSHNHKRYTLAKVDIRTAEFILEKHPDLIADNNIEFSYDRDTLFPHDLDAPLVYRSNTAKDYYFLQAIAYTKTGEFWKTHNPPAPYSGQVYLILVLSK